MSFPRSSERGSPPIGAHRAIGDRRSAALITPTATIDWWCAPRFDSPPVLWSLLDSNGAMARFENVTAVDVATAAAGAATWTRLDTECGAVEVHDAMIEGRVLRVVRALHNDLSLVHHCTLGGFDHSRASGPYVHQLQARQGVDVALVIGPDGIELVDPSTTRQAITETLSRFGRDNHNVRSRHHADRVRDALDVMNVCSYGETGTVVAAITTSLPENPGGDRNFDYRYSWLRDGSLAASVAALHGRLDIGRDHLTFVADLSARVFESPVFTVDGGRVPTERRIGGTEGWDGSRPVRVGNAAAEQVQFDALGFVVEAVSTYTREGGRLTRALWHTTCLIADRCTQDDPVLTSGIWELREPQRVVSADIGRWIALDRASRVARRRRPWTRHRRRWLECRDSLAERILSELRDDGRIPQIYGGDPDHLDASALLIVMFGILDTRDPRAQPLVDAHIRVLGEGAHLRRYPSALDDGFQQPEATFVPCSWWTVTALAAIGRLDQATERADELCRSLPRLMSEEFDPATGEALGNTPLLWAHVEAARALRVLEVQELRGGRWGGAGVLAENLYRRADRRAQAGRRRMRR
jgi:GH15 family glucan-1,4-alpha-glucosidase